MSGPRRNVEIKAIDPDPALTLERALELGAEDQGELVQRDTYFRVPNGRLKLREEEPGGEAHLIAYERADEGEARPSSYRLIAVPDPEALRTALAGALGVRVVVDKRRRLLLYENVRIHLDEVAGLGSFVELEAVAPPGSDLALEHEQVARLRAELGIGELYDGSYADLLTRVGPDPELVRMAREAAGRAYAPYSGFPVGAALRTADGRRYAGANVENAAYPQGQCAEASALGAMVADGGPGRVVEVVVAAPSEQECTPCGGCRQRLREFMHPDAPIHLADMERIRRTTTLAELLPLSFGPETLG